MVAAFYYVAAAMQLVGAFEFFGVPPGGSE
jgi:hypothetical protein